VRTREVYRCQNRDCRCEIRLIKASTQGTSNPRCFCGAEMKKPYVKPVFQEIGNSGAQFFSVLETRRKERN